MKPFVHRFRTQRSCYLYDVHTNNIIKVGRAVYDVIDHFDETDPDRIIGIFRDVYPRDLILKAMREIGASRMNHGLFLPERPTFKVSEFGKEHLSEKIDRELKSITLCLTDKCNLRCSYCVYSGNYEGRRTHGSVSMTFGHAKASVEHLLKHSDPTVPPAIAFYGGEPLLEFDLLKKTTEYAVSVFPHKGVSFTVTTNGTLLNDEMLDFFSKHDFILLISLDGPEEYHNRGRRFPDGSPSFNKILETVGHIRNNYPGLCEGRVNFSVVLNPPASYKVLDGFFGEIGFNAKVSFIELGDDNDFSALSHIDDFDYLENKFKDAVIHGTYLQPENLLAYNVFRKNMLDIHRRSVPPTPLGSPSRHGTCIPGGFKLFVGSDGTLFPCEKMDGYPGTRIGHISHGIDMESLFSLFNGYRGIDWSQCSDCWAVRLCQCCFVHIMSKGRLDPGKAFGMCEFWRSNFDRMLKLYCSVIEEKGDAFDFLGNDSI